MIMESIYDIQNCQMISQGSKGKYIKQIKLNGNKAFFPNKFYTPYQFMGRLNESVKGRFDIQVIEVRYVISKSKNEKDFQDHNSLGSISPENQFNNIFNIDHPFMKQLLEDVIKLDPPTDFNPHQYDLENSIAKKQEEEKKIFEINDALQLIVQIESKKMPDLKSKELRSLNRFKMELRPALRDSQVDIYIKVILSKPVQERIQAQKNSGNAVIVHIDAKQYIKLYLHPCKTEEQNSQVFAKLCFITDWSLCAFFPQNSNEKKGGSAYFNVGQLSKKTEEINQSIKPMFYIATHKNKKGNLDSIQIYSFLFNEIILKSVISLSQIKKIQKFRSQVSQQVNYSEYYFHLSYPPRYFISILKPDIGSDDGYIRNWERTQNFAFLRNKDIMEDDFLRLYLFNNTIVKLKLNELDGIINVNEANNLLLKIITEFKGTIKGEMVPQPWDFKRKLTYFNTIFKYKNFKDKFNLSINNQPNFQQKNWKLKYLILVLIRDNCIFPTEVQKILSQIEKDKQDIDIYIYILWQKVVKLGSVSTEILAQPFYTYIEKQFAHIKKLSIGDITNKISSNTELIAFIFRASLTPSGILFNAPTPEMKGRLLKEYCHQSERFFRVSISDDNQGTLKNQKYITKKVLKEKMLRINVINRQYIPLGWSPSQLRSFSLWYIHEYEPHDFTKRLKRQQVLSFLGQFDNIQNAAKKAARIGQSFSSSWTYHCKDKQITQINIPDDFSVKEFNFTDGIGKISADLLQKLSLKLQIRDLSVLQVRYKGVKGILVLNPALSKNTIVLRPSMIKYQCKHSAAAKYLDVLDWNKFKAGFLNRQIIILLKSLGISDKVFQKKQAEHIEKISKLSFKDCSIFKHMNQELNTDLSNLQPANVTILHLLRAGFRLQNQPFFRGVLQTMKKNGYHQLKIKCNIMIDKSARIIGIIDEWNILQEGELFCTIADNFQIQTDRQQKRQNVEGDVFVTRNPCLHPADIRKLKCVAMSQIQSRFEKRGQQNIFINYVNCIIFPKKGEIPVTSQISGSDLDGDNFFICWDKQLIPVADQAVYTIDNPTSSGVQSKKEKKVVSYAQMIDFFIEYLNYEKLGQIDNSHLVHADQSPHYAKSKECMELAIIHGKAVDFPKSGFCPEVDPRLLVTKYPDFMQKQESPQYRSGSILGQLYRDILQKIKNLLADKEAAEEKIDDDLIKQLIKEVDFQSVEIRQALSILLDYEKEMTGLIHLAGIDTEYEIYSGNFSIAKDKVKAFGKNRLIATILALRARYFQEFFSNRAHDKEIYINAKEQDLQSIDLFGNQTRRRALLFYLCSYVIKFSLDENFLNDQRFRNVKKLILNQYHSLTYNSQGKYAGFVWFVVPKIVINQKYRIKKLKMQELSKLSQEQPKKQNFNYQDEEMI